MSGAKSILFLNEFYHPDICASAVVAADHLTQIARLRPDYRITVIAGNRAWNDPSITYPETDECDGIRIIRVKRPALRRNNLLRRAMGFAAFQRGAVKAAGRLDRVDLVIATTAPPQGAKIAAKIAARRRCPYIYKVLDLYPDLAACLGKIARDSLLYRRWLGMDTKLMNEAARVVTIGQGITDRLVATRHIESGKLLTIHDGFDPERLGLPAASDERRPEQPNTFRQEHNPDGRFVVQYAGNMGLSHPFDAILKACRSLAEEEIQFQFIGDGPQRPHIEAQLPAGARLIDFQPADRLGEVLGAADVCLISQHDDMHDKALPYKVYGIFAAAKPAVFIGNAKSEIAQWLKEADAGLHVEQDRPDDLADAIRTLKADPARARSMGRAARRLLDEKLHSRFAAQRWATLIDEVVA